MKVKIVLKKKCDLGNKGAVLLVGTAPDTMSMPKLVATLPYCDIISEEDDVVKDSPKLKLGKKKR